MMLAFSLYIALLGVALGTPANPKGGVPKVHIKNGTYAGVYSPEYEQDFFLGIPFARPPLGSLRFANPASLNTTWTGERSATQYALECAGYGNRQYNYSEDCLYLNVIRPAECASNYGALPVAVWIHGGGFTQGGAGDMRFNLSYTVDHSVKLGKPIIAVSINYRLSAWGFLNSAEVAASGNSNFGLRDQRLALHWIQENIAAFGGDPRRVTIWGESAGAASVGFHLTAFNGRDDFLFRGAMMESGNPIFYGASNQTTAYQKNYNALIAQAGCNGGDSLGCLRRLPYDQLNAVVNTTQFDTSWGPQVDGDFFVRHTSQQVAEGAFVKVPILLGANSDEGTSFGTQGLNTTDQFLASLNKSGVPPDFANKIINTYPLRSPEQILDFQAPDWTPPAYPYGLQWRRVATYSGDQVFIANRRACCAAWAKAGIPAYCYRFDAVPAISNAFTGATHFTEMPFVFLDLSGNGYPPVDKDPFMNRGQDYADLARLMNGDWIAFVVSQNPNDWPGRSMAAKTLGTQVPDWPVYSDGENGCTPQVFLFRANLTSAVQNDDFRKQGVDLINSGNLAVYDR